jgi:probable F420-dependent oxidoreductase
MKFGLFAMNYGTCADPATAVRIALHAENAGLESLWTAEHIVLPDPQPARFSMPPALPFMDTVVALTLLAAHTSRIKLGSGIIELPLHHPVMLAKQLAGVDIISDGRLLVGVGAGYLGAEFEAMGVPLSERGPRMDEYLAAINALWTSSSPEFHGRFVDFSGVNAFPRPTRPAGPPIVIGGEGPAARRRAITKGNGWYLFGLDQAEVREALDSLHADLDRHERPAALGPLEISVTPVDRMTAEMVDEYAEMGVDRLVLLPRLDTEAKRRHEPVPADEILQTIDTIAAWVQ